MSGQFIFYSLQDAYRATTGYAVRKARLGEIKHEMFTSEKLKVSKLCWLLVTWSLNFVTAKFTAELKHLKNVLNCNMPRNAAVLALLLLFALWLGGGVLIVLYYSRFVICLLQTYFEENPRDKQILRHDTARGVVKLQQHLKNVPDYISK